MRARERERLKDREQFCGGAKRQVNRQKLKKMELIYILNVMIIINGKFNFTHTPKARGNSPQTGRVLNVIVKKKVREK